MRLLFIGDIVGKPGTSAIKEILPVLVSEYNVEFIIANAENAANGLGLTRKVALDFFDSAIDILTSGNHIWDKKSIVSFIKKEPRLLRPANFPDGVPGKGSIVVKTASGEKIGILNLSGRVFMGALDCPFQTAMREIDQLKLETDIIIVDIHAEATSEKIAMGWMLDGKVSAVLGTHTHVQTADEKILPGGTAYISDIGMTGSFDSVIGMKKEISIERFLTQMPVDFKVAEKDICLSGVYLEIDSMSGKATYIKRIQKKPNT